MKKIKKKIEIEKDKNKIYNLIDELKDYVMSLNKVGKHRKIRKNIYKTETWRRLEELKMELMKV